MAYRQKAWQLQAEVHTLRIMWIWWSWHSTKKAVCTPDIERDGSPVLPHSCEVVIKCVLPNVLVLRKADKLALRYQCLENVFLHILLLYLEFRYCCVNQFGYILFIVYIRFVVFFYRLVNKVDHMLRSWSEVSEEMQCATAEWSQPTCIPHHRFVVAKEPWPQSC